MISILLSITSYQPEKIVFLKQLVSEYIENYSQTYKLTFILSINYELSEPINFNGITAIFLKKEYHNWEHCWNNRKWIMENYNQFDYIIECDDDILIPKATFENYIESNNFIDNDLSFIIGNLSAEQDRSKKNKLITGGRGFEIFLKVIKIKDRLFGIPNLLHSANFICDKKRFELALSKMDIHPPTILRKYNYTCGEWARTNIYKNCGFTKIIDISKIDNDCLVFHLPNKYIKIRPLDDAVELQKKLLNDIDKYKAFDKGL